MTPVRMPQVGENLTTGVVLEWSAAEGAKVERGDVLAVVESEKAAFEVTADAAGVLLRIDCPAGQEADVLGTIAWIGETGEEPPAPVDTGSGAPAVVAAPAGASAPAPVARARPAAAVERPDRVPSRPTPQRIFASPSARRLARQLLVDLHGVRGSGPAGRIVRRDVLAAALADAGGSPAAVSSIEPVVDGGDRVEPHTRLRAAIAERMSISNRDVPHFYLFADIDLTEAQTLRAGFAADPPVSITDVVVAAVARSLRTHERVNAHVGANGVVLKAGRHVGLAVAVDGGILVPALADADRCSLAELAARRVQLVESARTGVVAQSPAPTFTITSLAGFDVDRFLPIINPPECGILAVGRGGDRVVARDGEAVVRQVMTVCLACDHRAVDGAGAAAFLRDVRLAVEQPQQLLDAVQ